MSRRCQIEEIDDACVENENVREFTFCVPYILLHINVVSKALQRTEEDQRQAIISCLLEVILNK